MKEKPGKAIHSVHNIKYHIVLVTKYRQKVINDNISNELKDIFKRISKTHHIKIIEWNHDKDHIHILCSATPVTCLSKFINAYKSASSRLIKKNHPEIKNKLWKEHFWSRSYYIVTRGGATLDEIKKYIQEQGE